MLPSVTFASSMPWKPETARSMVDLPAPLVPSTPTIWPGATASEMPCSAVIARWYTTSSLSMLSIGSLIYDLRPRGDA